MDTADPLDIFNVPQRNQITGTSDAIALPQRRGVPKITYANVSLGDIKLIREPVDPEKDGPNDPQRISRLVVAGDEMLSSQRFLTSMCAIYGFAPSIFTYFTPEEVLSRIMAKRRGDIRLTIEHDPVTGGGMALGVSKPTKPIIDVASLTGVLNGLGIKMDDTEYHNGSVVSWHRPSIGADFNVREDTYATRFVVETPIDGYGSPAAFLALIRAICVNGAIAYTKAFRSQVSLGTDDGDAIPSMGRFIESFSNEEGFAAFRSRFVSALTTPVSLDEYFGVYNLLHHDDLRSVHRDSSGKPVYPFASVVTEKLRKLCGSLEVYGLVNFESLSQKKRRAIPTTGRMYDLVNFVTELATHHSTTAQARRLQAWVGTAITNEYDLEGTLSDTEEPVDLFFGNSKDEEEADPTAN